MLRDIMQEGRGEYFESRDGLTMGEGQAFNAGFEYAVKRLVNQSVQPTLSYEDVINKIRTGAYEPTVDPNLKPGSIAFTNNRKAVREQRQALLKQFEADALDATGLAGHPKANKLFAYAWSEEHSSGLEAVLGTLSDLAAVLL